MPNIKIICKKCEYTKEIVESEYFNKDECPLCGGEMILDMVKQPKECEPIGDNFPCIPDREREMRDSLGLIGAGHSWYLIEQIADVRLRLQYRKTFFDCGGTIPEREELK